MFVDRSWLKNPLIFAFGVFCLNLVLILMCWWQGSSFLLLQSFAGSWWIALGRLTGLLAEYFILLELVFVGRIRFLERHFAFDRMNKLHRWIGTYLLLFLFAHPVCLVIGYAISSHTSLMGQVQNFLLQWEDVAKAFIGLFLFVFAISVSYSWIRKRLRYETWYAVHLMMYLGIGLAFGHQINTADVASSSPLYYWLALNFCVFGLILVYRFIRPFTLFFRHRFRVERIVQETEDVTSVYISGRNLSAFSFQAGQFAHLMFLAKGLWFSHPFSFSAAPNGQWLRFSMKSLGDFTSRVGHIPIGTSVLIDGPMGLFTASQAKTGKYLLIAGGIGITPIRALVEELIHENGDLVLLYANRDEKNLAFKQELEHLMQERQKKSSCHFILSDVTTLSSRYQEIGRIDREKIVRLVPDFLQRDVYVCGPPSMMDAMIGLCRDIGIPKNVIHYEKFGY